MTTRSLDYTTLSDASPAGLPSDGDIVGRAGSENFRVASVVLPRSARQHFMAFYGFARLVDQLGDDYPGDRAAALSWAAAETGAALRDQRGRYPLIAAAAAAVGETGADPQNLFDLIEANRLDQTVTGYETFEDLLGYCRLSANPVGRLVLAALGCRGADEARMSDSICTGLQLVEHWQDVAEDAARGRVYLPKVDMRRFGVERADLTTGQAAGRPLRALMAFEAARARRWLDAGRELIHRVPGRARWAVAGFWAGGHAALDELAGRDFDVLAPPGRPSPGRVVAYTAGAVLRPASHRGVSDAS